MSFQATAYQVMIASPSDVIQERLLIRQVLHEWNAIYAADRAAVLLPVGWDTHATPEMGDRAQGIINDQVLRDCDLLVAVFWTRIGSPTGKAISGTVEEIQEHIENGRPAMIYFSVQPVRLDSVDADQYKAVKEFQSWCKGKGLVETFGDTQEFREKFTWQLAKKALGILKSNAVASSNLRDLMPGPAASQHSEEIELLGGLRKEARQLLLEAVQDKQGVVIRVAVFGGTIVQTNARQFVERGNPRSVAIWEAAIQELLAAGFVQDQGSGEVFKVTAAGYRAADDIKLGRITDFA